MFMRATLGFEQDVMREGLNLESMELQDSSTNTT